jgi:hypothetical protein
LSRSRHRNKDKTEVGEIWGRGGYLLILKDYLPIRLLGSINDGIIFSMKKRIIDLSPQELESAARIAWKSAAEAAFARGEVVTGSRDGRRFRYHPDGRVEDLGPVESFDGGPENNRIAASGKRSVA